MKREQMHTSIKKTSSGKLAELRASVEAENFSCNRD